MPDKGWHRTFDYPIPLPGGGELRTLREAANYITELPRREHDVTAWRAAIGGLGHVYRRRRSCGARRKLTTVQQFANRRQSYKRGD